MSETKIDMAKLRKDLFSGLSGTMTTSQVLEKTAAVAKDNMDVNYKLDEVKFITPSVIKLDGMLCRLSDTAKNQLGSLFGVKWSKWFDVPGIDPDRVQTELSARISLYHEDPSFGTKLFRLRKASGNAQGVQYVVRGILSGAYTTIDDLKILNIIQSAVGSQLIDSTARVVSNPWEEASCDENTNITFFLDQPIVVENGSKDIFYPGIHFSNSEVGRKAVRIEDALMRVVCTNGMIRVISNNSIFHQIHRKMDDHEVERQLVNVIADLQKDLAAVPSRIKASHGYKYTQEQFDTEVERFVTRNRLPNSFKDTVHEAFNQEPDLSRFGLIQALTLGAHALGPDSAYMVERSAAQLLN